MAGHVCCEQDVAWWLQGPQHQEEVAAVAVSPCGALGASASADGTVKLWDLLSAALSDTLRGHTEACVLVCFILFCWAALTSHRFGSRFMLTLICMYKKTNLRLRKYKLAESWTIYYNVA